MDNKTTPIARRPVKLGRSDYERSKALQIVFGDKPIVHVGAEIYEVPSLSAGGLSRVCNLARGTCTCPKWRSKYKASKKDCHHLLAAKIIRDRSRIEQGHEITAAEMKASFGRKNEYKNPPYYDFVATRQPLAIRELARCLTMQLEGSELEEPRRGRPAARIGDVMFGLLEAAYSAKGSRRAIDDPYALQRDGYTIGLVPAYNTRLEYMLKPETTELLRELHRQTILPLRALEHEFAIDSKSLKTPYSRIIKQTTIDGVHIAQRMLNAKLHIASGLATHAIISLEVSDGDQADSTFFQPLFEPIGKMFTVDTILADAAYSDAKCYEMVHAYGANAFINFHTGARPQRGFPHHDYMLDMWQNRYDEWHETYRLRNNAESTNSAYARLRSRVVRARYAESRLNEILAHAIVYNLGVLAMAARRHEVTIPFADARAHAAMSGYRGELVQLKRAAA